MSKPKIALTACSMARDPQRALFKDKRLQYFEHSMAEAILRAGGVPIGLLDLADDELLRQLLRDCDGLLLQGGADVSPKSYGETAMQPEWSGDFQRDQFESAAIRIAIELGKPVLGICRGAQILNVAMGGSLYQDIETQIEGSLTHRNWDPYDKLQHSVELNEDCWLHSIYKQRTLQVNSVHHQSIKDLAPGFKLFAKAPDGVHEGLEKIDDKQWMVGIQWHPEWLPLPAEADRKGTTGHELSDGSPIFNAFVERCRT